MTTQPGHRPQPTATPAGQPTPTDADRAQAARWLAALDELGDAKPTAVRVDDPDIPSHKDGPRIGTTPPVQQPGRPGMSQRAVDLNTTLISSSVVIGMTGAATTGVLLASGQANPTVIAWVCACVVAVPAAIALPVLALKGLMKSAKEVVQAAPPVTHNHYGGANVYQDQRKVESKNTGLWVRNTNELPR